MEEYRERLVNRWEEVRPVVIYFAGERFVVEYDEHHNPLLSPAVAMVASFHIPIPATTILSPCHP
jgi:hypothetical protein